MLNMHRIFFFFNVDETGVEILEGKSVVTTGRMEPLLYLGLVTYW